MMNLKIVKLTLVLLLACTSTIYAQKKQAVKKGEIVYHVCQRSFTIAMVIYRVT